MQNNGITKKNFLRGVLPPSWLEQLKISNSCGFYVECVDSLFVYLHFMDCIHVLYSTLRLSLRFVPANHKQLSLPFSALKSLEKDVVYKAASGKAVNRLASDLSWSHLNIGPALRLEVGPLWKTREILQ